MKISRWTRILAIVLVIAMSIQMLPIQAFAVNDSGSITFQEYESQPVAEDPYSLTVLGEVESLREEDTKHFRLSDGSFVAVAYGMPVHYEDENGKWQDIDNTLVARSNSFTTANAATPAAYFTYVF